MSEDSARRPSEGDQPSWAPFGRSTGEDDADDPAAPPPARPEFDPPRPPTFSGQPGPPSADLAADRPPAATPPPPTPPLPPPPTPAIGRDASPPASRGGATPGSPRTPGNATAALVLALVGLVFCPIICSVAAIVLGIQARREIDADPALGGRGVATTGLVLGVVGLFFGVIGFALLLSGQTAI